MLLGLVNPTAGEIDILGQRMERKHRLQILQQVGALIEAPSYYGHLNLPATAFHIVYSVLL